MKSMTGYGRAKVEQDNRRYGVEIKSVNHKYSDISIKLPRELMQEESNIKKEIAKNMARGKIDVFVTFENDSKQGKQILINEAILEEYQKQFSKIEHISGLKKKISYAELLQLPEVLTIKTLEEKEDQIQEELLTCVKQAIQNFIAMRQEEGNRIKEDLKARLEQVEKKVEKISFFSTGLLEEYVVKLKERIKQITKQEVLDEARIATEVVIYADKCSIEEELTRLRSHVNQMKQMMEEETPVGKKMDFLLQEMNRETNTIGSKSVTLEITNLVVEVKTILEDIREQVQNIE